jgi:hypothetical protein
MWIVLSTHLHFGCLWRRSALPTFVIHVIFCLSIFVTGDILTAQTHNCKSIHCIQITDPSVAILNKGSFMALTVPVVFVTYLETLAVILAEECLLYKDSK